jgi:hypothetical protein
LTVVNKFVNLKEIEGDFMTLTKSDLFLVQLKRVVTGLNRNIVKTRIGDSTLNNRTLTVNQVIRFLSESRKQELKNLGVNLGTAYSQLRPLILEGRAVTRNRTDAIDINEFIAYYTTFVVALSNKTARVNFSKQLVGEISI